MINTNNNYNGTANSIQSECYCPHKLPFENVLRMLHISRKSWYEEEVEDAE